MNDAPDGIERTRAVANMLIATLLTMAALYFARPFLVPIALAVLLTSLLRPVVRRLERFGLAAPAGSAIVVLSLLLVIGVGVFALADPVRVWLKEAPADLQVAQAKLSKIRRSVERVTDAAEKLGQSSGSSGAGQTAAPAAPPGIASALGTTTTFLGGLAEVLVLLYLLLASGNLFLRKLIGLLPVLSDKKRAVSISDEVEGAVARYLLTTLAINIAQGAITGAAMFFLGMPNPVLWGGLTVLLEFVPFLGAAFMVGLLAIAAIGHFDAIGHALLIPATYLIITTLQNNLVSPIAYGQRLRLNSVAVMIGVLFWWFLWGVAGAFLAVPFVASLKILADHVEGLAPLGEFLGE
ncbi:MAG: AI-2E family transporter [Gemmatimonadota bacterium]